MRTLETREGTELHWKDWEEGQRVVFNSAYCPTADSFEDELFFMASQGYRCIAADRQGLDAQASTGTVMT